VSGVTVDPLDNDYLQEFSILGHVPDASFNFDLNRIAFLIGGNADASAAGLQDVEISTNVPEPASLLLGLASVAAGLFVRRRCR
jgi:PEP-CTERM motif